MKVHEQNKPNRQKPLKNTSKTVYAEKYPVLWKRLLTLLEDCDSIKPEHVTQKATLLQLGLTAEDCGFKSVTASGLKKAKSVVAAKYRSPNGETWSGRGRAPKWLEALEAQGRQRAEFSIS